MGRIAMNLAPRQNMVLQCKEKVVRERSKEQTDGQNQIVVQRVGNEIRTAPVGTKRSAREDDQVERVADKT